MVKPRVFVSSTYYDLKHIRNNLRSFIDSFGYEAVLFEDGDIPYNHLLPLDQSCYSEVTRCHMLVLIIGGRYGSQSSAKESVDDNENCDSYKSITAEEYQSARDKDIPIFIFIERNVYSEYRTYKANVDNPSINYAHVDNVKVFEFIDQILSQKINNQVCEFDKFEDISNWLKDQWAGLFAEYLRHRQDQKALLNISSKIDELAQVSEALRTYTESLMKKVQPDGYDALIQAESKKIKDANKRKIFYEHHFPEMIMERAKAFKVKLRKDDIYPVFIQTDDFIKFLSALGFSEEVIDIITNLCMYYDEFMDLKMILNRDSNT